jgi:YegS/Rv2252/BmrU family lipid kinase
MEHMVNEGGVVVYNPTAGRNSGQALMAQAKELLGPSFEWRMSQKPGHAVALAKEAAQSHQVIVAFGGDGTVGDVARGLLGTEATLGIFPVGTGNDVARNLHLPLEPREAAATILTGIVRRVDIGTINGTPFINNAGTGFDAQVMRTMNTSIRFTKGKPAFLLAILKTFPSFKPFALTLEADGGQSFSGKAMMVSILNGTMYGAGMQAAPHAEMDDGLLDVMIIKAMPKMRLFPLISKVTLGQHLNHPAVQMMQIRSLSMKTVPPQPLNIDGDVSGLTPAEIKVNPRVLKVLVR